MKTNNNTTSIRIDAEPDLYENLLAEKENRRKISGKSIALSKIVKEICRKWFNNGGIDQNQNQNCTENPEKSSINGAYVSNMSRNESKKAKELNNFEQSLIIREHELSEKERDILKLINDQLDQKNQLIDLKQAVYEKELDNSYNLRKLVDVQEELTEKKQIIANLTRELKEVNRELRLGQISEPLPKSGIAGFFENISTYLPVLNTGLLGYIVYQLKSNGQTHVNEAAINNDVQNFMGDVIDLVKSSKNKNTDEILQEVIKKYEKRSATGKPPKP